MSRVSIVIVSWNTRQLLEACLTSVNETKGELDVEIWVVDNASTDGSVQMVRERFPWVRLIENTDNVGFARGSNQAIRRCNGRQVLLLNPDTEVRPGALEALIQFLEEHPHIGAVGPMLLSRDGSLQISCYPTPTLPRELWRLFSLDRMRAYGSYDMLGWNPDRPRRVDVLQGSCLLLRREALNQVGLLDERFFVFSEELDLCLRLQRYGWTSYWFPQAKVVHHGGRSTHQVQVADEMFLHLYKTKLLFFRKHYGRPAGTMYKIILAAASLARILLSPVAWFKLPSAPQPQLGRASNYWRLLKQLPRI